MHLPRARTTKQNGLVVMRTAETKRLLSYIRQQFYPRGGRTEAQRLADTFGSPFTGTIPASAQEASVTVVDHVTPQSWFQHTEIIDVFAQAREDVVNTLLVPSGENSKKGAKPIRFIGIDADNPNAPDKNLYSPVGDSFTEARQAMCARRIFYTFLSYPLVSEEHNTHSALTAGCSYYANDRVHAHMLRIVRDETPNEHETFVDLLTLFVNRTHNPLVTKPDLLDADRSEFSNLFRGLLRARLDGDSALPSLCSSALQRVVAGFPT